MRPRLSRPRVVALVSVTIVVIVVIVGGFLLFSRGGGRSTDYDEGVEERFLEACTGHERGDPDIEPEVRRACSCAWGRIVDRVPFERFRTLDRAGQDGRDLPGEIARVIERCKVDT